MRVKLRLYAIMKWGQREKLAENQFVIKGKKRLHTDDTPVIDDSAVYDHVVNATYYQSLLPMANLPREIRGRLSALLDTTL